ncbi:MAG: hypothetical protein HY741_19310 [Chloroflexi bacterium]|nr:hypothetical protein [Chloroflexota bacterium]
MLLTEVLPTVQQLSRNDKLHLVRILVDELDATNEIAPFEPNKVYHIYTPYNMYGVAHLLMEAFEKAKPKEGKVE